MTAQGTARWEVVSGYGFLLGVAALVVVCDQTVKAVVTSKLGAGSSVDLFGGLITLDYTRNTGAAFGTFQSGGLLFVAVAIVVSVGILVYYRRVQASGLVVRVALALILGGALGNVVDRVRLGYVVDFIDLHWWPVFNLADSAIVVGVVLLSLYALLRPTQGESR